MGCDRWAIDPASSEGTADRERENGRGEEGDRVLAGSVEREEGSATFISRSDGAALRVFWSNPDGQGSAGIRARNLAGTANGF